MLDFEVPSHICNPIKYKIMKITCGSRGTSTDFSTNRSKIIYHNFSELNGYPKQGHRLGLLLVRQKVQMYIKIRCRSTFCMFFAGTNNGFSI